MSQIPSPLPDAEGAPRARSRQPRSLQRAQRLDTGRLNGFSDGVFAFAATLLVLQLVIPDPSKVALNQLGGYLASSHFAAQAGTFVISFLVVAAYRTAHHRLFTRIASVDGALILLNTAFLLGIAFLPFTTGLFASFTGQTAFNLYATNLGLAGLLLVVMDLYANAHPEVLIGRPRRQAQILVHLATPAIFFLSMLLAFVNVTLAALSWILTAVVEGVVHRLWPTTMDDSETDDASSRDVMADSEIAAGSDRPHSMGSQ
ncbi:MAG TPA: TMEM175 family protein [Ktedonobacterales bacterium]|nr:TMEM175 family protein [Ktedonobacterales bacterium]